jgi:hypothetical protein
MQQTHPHQKMKTIAKVSFVAITLALLTSSAAFADDQQLRQLLDVRRAQAERDIQQTTVAVSAGGRGVGRRTATAARTGSRFQLRYDQHGQAYGTYVPASR